MSRLLKELQDRGFTVRLKDGRVVVTPASKLTPELRQRIRDHQADLAVALTPPELWSTYVKVERGLLGRADERPDRPARPRVILGRRR